MAASISNCWFKKSLDLLDYKYFILSAGFESFDTPSLKDLYQNVTPRYTADWRVIGTLLGIPNGELKAIEAQYPTNLKWCCNRMLEKWLETDATASWDKIFEAIRSPAVSAIPENGM